MKKNAMMPLKKGESVYLEFTADVDTSVEESNEISKLFIGKEKFDKLTLQSITLKDRLMGANNQEMINTLTKILLENNLLDANLLNNLAYNGGGIK